MFDHIGFGVADFARSKAFYECALAPLGITIVREATPQHTGGSAHAAFGVAGRAFFWIGTGRAPTGRLHVAFAANDRASVDAFHRAAIEAGGSDNGPPGLRPHYHANYYGAFVLDPDGHNIEAVYRKPD
jgi:catechol 2,3-dioxygenase-like lactoylglutathione lyase family enzyme